MSSYSASPSMMTPAVSPSSIGAMSAATLNTVTPDISSPVVSNFKESDFFGLVGPLGKKYCYLFYILSISMLFFFFVAVIHLIKDIIMLKTEKRDFAYFFNATMIIVILGVKYLGFRLLFSMCTNSL